MGSSSQRQHILILTVYLYYVKTPALHYIFLADRTGRAIGTVLRPSSVCLSVTCSIVAKR